MCPQHQRECRPGCAKRYGEDYESYRQGERAILRPCVRRCRRYAGACQKFVVWCQRHHSHHQRKTESWHMARHLPVRVSRLRWGSKYCCHYLRVISIRHKKVPFVNQYSATKLTKYECIRYIISSTAISARIHFA